MTKYTKEVKIIAFTPVFCRFVAKRLFLLCAFFLLFKNSHQALLKGHWPQ